MSFWEDASPIVKGALIVGVLGILYLGVAFGVGFFPFAASCTHEVGEETVSGCAEGTECVDGECRQSRRGIAP